MEENTKQSDTLVSLLRELAVIESDIALARAAKFAKESKEFVGKKVKSVSLNIQQAAKNYGQNKEKADKILADYANELYEIRKMFSESGKEYLQTKVEAEKEEMNNVFDLKEKKQELREIKRSDEYQIYRSKVKRTDDLLKEELSKQPQKRDMSMVKSLQNDLEKLLADDKLAKCEKDIEGIKSNLNSSRHKILMAKQGMKNNEQKYKNAVELATEDKEKGMTTIKKQNIVQKMLGAVLAKIGGTRKFENNVIKPLTNKVRDIKEIHVPKIKQELEASVMTFLSKKEIQANQLGNNVKSFAIKGIDNIKNTSRDIIRAGKEAKNNIIESSKKTINERVQERNEALNHFKNNKEGTQIERY